MRKAVIIVHLLRFVVVVSQYSIFALDTDVVQKPVRPCPRLPKMDFDMCDLEDIEVEKLTDSLPHGTTCMLNPQGGDLRVMVCDDSNWMETRERKGIDSQPDRERRATDVVIWLAARRGAVPCAMFCNKSEDDYSSITCPVIPSVIFTDKLEISKRVTWKPAIAYDKTRGRLSTYITSGSRPGDSLSEGSHHVTYMAKDHRGKTAICTKYFTVKVRRCSSSHTYLSNGKASCSANTLYGSSCNFSCNAGYEISGQANSECLSNSKWSTNKPACKKISCGIPAPVLHGTFHCVNFDYGAECGLICTDMGYSLQGSSTIKCQENKNWTAPGHCVDVLPPSIRCNKTLTVYTGPLLSSKSVSWAMPEVEDNSNQSVNIISIPATGDSWTAGLYPVTFIATDKASLQSQCYTTVDVQVARCSASEGVPYYANVTCSYGNVYGSDCTFECLEGYELTGEKNRSCQENGKWTGKHTSCKPRPCPNPPFVANGIYKCPSGQEFQDKCTLVCKDGYKTAPPFTITCTAAGSWTPAGSCFDVQAPVFPYGCPDVRIPANRIGEPTYLSYDLPIFTDNSGGIMSSLSEPQSGTEFITGSTSVTVTAIDSQGLSETCNFIVAAENISCDEPLFESGRNLMLYDCPDKYVYGAVCNLSCSDKNSVQGAQSITCDKNYDSNTLNWTWVGDVAPYCQFEACPKLKEPKNGSLSCSSILRGTGQQCIVSCNDQYTHPETVPGVYICFESKGTWTNAGFVPDCLERRKPTRSLARTSFSFNNVSCDENNTEVKIAFLKAIRSTLLTGICSRHISCDVHNVTISCTTNNRRRRAAQISQVVTEIIAEVDFGEYKDQGRPIDTLGYYERLVEEINGGLMTAADEGVFNIPTAGTFDNFAYASPAFTCDPGTLLVYQTLSCTGCGEGHMFQDSTQSCRPCPVGTYQKEEVSTSCTQCPSGMTTINTGSVSEQQCLYPCKPGEYSSTGLIPCYACPKGSYQAVEAMTSCELCPFGMTTLADKAASRMDCLFYNIWMGNETLQPAIHLPDPNPDNFTFLMWLHPVSSSTIEILELSMNGSSIKRDLATFSLGSFQLFVGSTFASKAQNVRKWYHVSVTYNNRTTILYINGKETERAEDQVMDFSNRTFMFTQSDTLKSIMVSGIQMTASLLESDEVQEFSSYCNLQVENNILGVSKVDTTLITPSTCDDVDDCEDDPCGEFGICIDGLGKFTCVCVEPWSGDRCEVVPDFCLDHKCVEGSKCVNNFEEKTYTCECPTGYTGGLCVDRIVNGNWGEWNGWGPCSVTCGKGQTSRSRECNNPSPSPEGEKCHGSAVEHQSCDERICPVNGQWSEWSAWSCTATCGNGMASRQRRCDNPAPKEGGIVCIGSANSFKNCEQKSCPVEGKFGEWTDWSQCSVACGGGVSHRTRACDSPPPANGGALCNSSQATESRVCNTHNCPVCRDLKASGHGLSFNCIYYKVIDMKICNITCQLGMMMMPDDLNEFKCGRLTNYTWSHQTRDNPTGVLPKCTDVKIPTSQKTVLSVQFDNINCNNPPPNSEFKNSLETNLKQIIKCKITKDCSSDIKTTFSCGKSTRSTGSIVAVITVEVPQTGRHEEYLQSLSVQDIEAQMNRLNIIENMTVQLINRSAQMAKVDISGEIFTGAVKFAHMELKCQDGAGFLHGLCADCPAGFYSTGNGSCLPCEKGFYQDQARSTSCIKCPKGLTTAGIRASSQNDCLKDPTDYTDYFDWIYDDLQEQTIITAASQDKSAIDDTLIIGSVLAATLVLSLFCTYVIVYKIRKQKSMQRETSLTNVFFNEVYNKDISLLAESHDVRDKSANIYDEIGPSFEKKIDDELVVKL